MESIFKISRLGEFGLLIEGLESDAGQYLSLDNVSISHRAYRWDHSVTINKIYYVNAEGTETPRGYHVVNHEECCTDRLEIQLDKDGLYRVAHIILPTKVWIDYAIEIGEIFNLYNKVYFYDNGKFYLWGPTTNTEVSIDIIAAEYPADTNTIIRSDKNTFAMYYLNSCFNTLLKDLLKDVPKVGNNCEICSDDSFDKKVKNRDLMWMFINIIKYSLDMGKLYEAQRFLEKFWRCNNFCGNTNLKTISNNCGCK